MEENGAIFLRTKSEFIQGGSGAMLLTQNIDLPTQASSEETDNRVDASSAKESNGSLELTSKAENEKGARHGTRRDDTTETFQAPSAKYRSTLNELHSKQLSDTVVSDQADLEQVEKDVVPTDTAASVGTVSITVHTALPTPLPRVGPSFFSGRSDFRITGGRFYNVQGNMYTQRDGTSYTMNGSQNNGTLRGNANTGRQYSPNPYPAPSQYAGPPNPQYQYGAPNNQFPPQAYRPFAQNLERSQTLPGTNPQLYSTPNWRQGRGLQYNIAHLTPQVNPCRAPSLRHAVSAPTLGSEYPCDGRGPKPAAMATSRPCPPRNDFRRHPTSYSPGTSYSSEQIDPSSWLSVSKGDYYSDLSSFSSLPENTSRAPHTPSNRVPPAANPSYREPRGYRSRGGSSSGSDSEEIVRLLSPARSRIHFNPSNLVWFAKPQINPVRAARPQSRLHLQRQHGRDDRGSYSETELDSDGTACVPLSSGPRRTSRTSARHPSTSTRSSINHFQFSASTSRTTHPSISLRPLNSRNQSPLPRTSSRSGASPGRRRSGTRESSRASSGSDDEAPPSHRRRSRSTF
ncbi:hypothetical protein K438DRAFT_814670 [Mycena galopus ATCC 62051]|nr:hypothetical protein K438DRAFT_814670 [Mycena galopus ATCC 62051]